MKKILAILFSMKTTLILMIVFAITIGIATFIENDFGTVSARALIYNARWFEFLLFLIALNLFGIIVNYKLYRRDRLPIFFFHASFLIILLGAAITRFYGYEGIMHIREGESTNKMISDRAYLQVAIIDKQKSLLFEKPLFLTPIQDNYFKEIIKFDKEEFVVELINYLPNVKRVLIPKTEGQKGISLVVNNQGVRENISLLEGEIVSIGEVVLGFETKERVDILFKLDNQNNVHIISNQAIEFMKMDDSQKGKLEENRVHRLQNRVLYTIKDIAFVLENALQNATYEYKSMGFSRQGNISDDMLILKVSSNNQQKELTLFGTSQKVGIPQKMEMAGKIIMANYGAKEIILPFSIKLRDFELSRYPGSNSPSGYASEVTVIDGTNSFDYRIYMNHILAYKGYRFYQASYDRDELGTILSVNHDYWGTLITYIGYILLGAGMIFSLILPNGRFRVLLSKLQKSVSTKLVLILLLPFIYILPLKSEEFSKDEALKVIKSISPSFADSFGELLIQDNNGRIKPIDTLATDILNKVARKESLLGLTHNQIVLGMLIRPNIFQNIRLIYISHPDINELLGLPKDTKYAAFSEFFDKSKPIPYKLNEAVEEASQKRAANQNKFDKEILKVDERLNIVYMVFSGSLFRFFPKPNDPNHKWYDPISSFDAFDEQNANQAKVMIQKLFEGLDIALESGDYQKANEALAEIKKNQLVYGASIIPPSYKINLEIFYNKVKIFENLSPFYLLFGFLLMIGVIAHIIKPFFNLKILSSIIGWILGVGFLLHTVGLIARWIISGHAPWSDGYESMIYAAWATMLAGFIFARNSPIALASTAIIAGVALFSAHLSWMDPQITNIVPVLNSYWLIIHVSMITASYGFLALGAMLGFIALLLLLFKTQKNMHNISKSISEITMVNEMTLIIGLILLTIGNFLGGVWANESWGRYWGWDPKETWALVTILVYAFVLHLRFIPILRSEFIFNSASIIAFSSVLMTYFGVNFYLSGLHSYAKGDPIPIPTFVYVSAFVVITLIVLAAIKESLFERAIENKRKAGEII